MIDPITFLQQYGAQDREILLAKAALISGGQGKTFLLGRNEHSQRLIGKIPIDGVVDDFEQVQTEWQGIRILKSTDLPRGALVVNCSMSIAPLSADARIKSVDHVESLSYAELCRLPSFSVDLPDFVVEAREACLTSTDKLKWVFQLLADEESRAVFNKLVAYRLTADYSYMQGFSVRFKDQYFEEFLGCLDGCTFVDCGGYDGDTTEEFIRRYPNYKKVFLFEPSEQNLARARARLQGVSGIEFVGMGVSDTEGVLSFDPNAGSACAISESGTASITVTTLDSYTDQTFSFIKMDLEGWELNALRGAAAHIARDRPVLAIAVYHSMSDFWLIPEYILSLSADYRVYLRHYTEGWSETVMYFIPK